MRFGSGPRGFRVETSGPACCYRDVVNTRILIVLLALAGIATGAVPALGATPPRARLRSPVCVRALDAEARAVGITAVMRPVRGTRKLAMRFALQGRKPGGRYTTIKGGDLGSWISPSDSTLGRRPGDTWIVNKQVVDLAAPVEYHFRVSFRWIGAHDRILGTASLQSPACRQPDLRPDLSVEGIMVSADATNPNLDRYAVTIHNRGATGVGSFQVEFAPGGTAAPVVRTLKGLAAHATVKTGFRGPLCNPASPPSVTVDPHQLINDLNPANNTLSATCPLS
jgi:CARDB